MIVTISSFTPNPPLQYNTDDLYLRGWYSNSFVAGDGVTPVEGGNGQTGFYYNILCTRDGSNNLVVPAFDVQATTDSNPTALFKAQLWVNGAPDKFLIPNTQSTSGWAIPTVYGSVVAFDELATYNAAVYILFNPPTYLTADQTIQEILRLAGNQQYAAVGVNGIGQPSVAPDVASAPIFWGINDPAVGDLRGGSLTPTVVPVALSATLLGDSQIVDDGTDVSIQTLNSFQAGDYQVLQNGSFISVDDSLTVDGGRASFNAGATGAVEYAGVVADCSTGTGEINLQTTGITNLYGVNQITTIGDGKDEQNGTKVIVNDPTRMVVQSVANQAPNDLSITSEQICFYLDESGTSLKARIRLSDNSYATWEGTYTPD